MINWTTPLKYLLIINLYILTSCTQLAGYEDVQPMVYCGLFPTSADDYQVRACMGPVRMITRCVHVWAAPAAALGSETVTWVRPDYL